jgi:hypothetical protein
MYRAINDSTIVLPGNPRSERIVTPVPDLRIVPDDL